MRLRITIDLTRAPKPQPPAEHDDVEYAPQVDVKGSSVLERSAQADFDPTQRIGFCRQETTP